MILLYHLSFPTNTKKFFLALRSVNINITSSSFLCIISCIHAFHAFLCIISCISMNYFMHSCISCISMHYFMHFYALFHAFLCIISCISMHSKQPPGCKDVFYRLCIFSPHTYQLPSRQYMIMPQNTPHLPGSNPGGQPGYASAVVANQAQYPGRRSCE